MNKSKPSKTDVQYESVRCKRNKKMLDALLEATPPVPKPEWRRWNAAMERIFAAMSQIESEMEAYRDQRTIRWRNGKSAYVLAQRLQDLRDARDAVAAWIDYPGPDPDARNFITLREREQ